MLTSSRLASCTDLCVHAEICAIRSALVEWSCTSSRWCEFIFESFLGCEEVPMLLQFAAASLSSFCSVNLRPSHRPVLIACSMQKWRGEDLVSFITWMMSVSTEHEALSCSFYPKRWSFERSRSKKSTAPGSSEECMCEMCPFDQRTLPFLSSNCS